MRVHDQLHPQVEAPPGEVHDEQRTRELYNTSGNGNRLIFAANSSANRLASSVTDPGCFLLGMRLP